MIGWSLDIEALVEECGEKKNIYIYIYFCCCCCFWDSEHDEHTQNRFLKDKKELVK